MKKLQRRRLNFKPVLTRTEKRSRAIERELAIAHAIQHKPLSMRQLARRMKVSAGGWLMDILCAMEEAGRILKHVATYRGGACKTRFTFSLPPNRIAAVAAAAWA